MASTTLNPQLLKDPVCEAIEKAISSSSAVFYPGDPQYDKGILHWASSSSEASKCVVEPGSASDVGIILGILGQTRTKFAVKGGGHTCNPGFSSTPGVQISMSRFSSVDYNSASQTVEIGAGLVWDDVYAALEPHGVNVVGGRVTGVGVAGLTLGGGYSWKSNQYGLTIDTVTAFELVKPDGTVVTVTETSDEDLFFGLKGGFNNFGIVTKFTLKTFPQTQVWGGFFTVIETDPHLNDLNLATANFSANVKDPKASIITTYLAYGKDRLVTFVLFYDAPTPPAGIFEDFLAVIKASGSDLKPETRSFLAFIQLTPSNVNIGKRARFSTVSLQAITPSILNVICDELQTLRSLLHQDMEAFVTYSVEPFLPSLNSHSTSPSAYPHSRTSTILPLNIYFAWKLPTIDNAFNGAINQSAARIAAEAVSQGQSMVASNAVYPNYATYDTPLENIYGSNLPRLRAIKAVVDPLDIMGLAGGFKF